MKKLFLSAIALLILVGVVGSRAGNVRAVAPTIDVRSNTTVLGATTTAPFLVAGAASSTLPTSGSFSLDSVSAVQLYMYSAASSSATKFTATIEYSNDQQTWYPYETASSTLLTSGSGAPAIVQWTPGAATTSRSVFITGPNNYAARYGRIQYQLLGANGQVYLEASLKKATN